MQHVSVQSVVPLVARQKFGKKGIVPDRTEVLNRQGRTQLSDSHLSSLHRAVHKRSQLRGILNAFIDLPVLPPRGATD